MRIKYLLDNRTKKLIEQIINDGDRAEVVPTKDGVKILRVMRRSEKEVK